MLIVWLAPALCAAQDLAPRAYLPLPVSSNAVIVTYGFSDGELLFDPTLPITDATGTIHAPVLTLYHAFGLFGRSANVTGSLPYAIGDFEGQVSGSERSAHRSGMADIMVRMAVNLLGAPSLSPAAFVKTPLPQSMLGASLKVLAPTGKYDPTLLINVGTNRWAFKPELGFTRRAGPVTLDMYAGVWLFTTNNEFYNGGTTAPLNTRTQEPIGAFEFHVSYDVKPRLWISADINYWRGGRTSVNGRESTNSLQANSRVGVTGSVPLTRRQSLKVSYSEGMIVRIGGNFRILSAGWQYGWVGKPFS
jgi:Putative MetA-pathway of phenol degradation